MDELDYKILACLKENARAKLSTIANEINLSITATTERIHRMEADGIITGYRVVIDESRMGKDLKALISVSLEHPRYNNQFAEMVQNHPDILECYYITGDYDFHLKVSTSGGEGLEKLLNYIKGIQGVSLTRTLVVLSTIKSEF